MEYIQLALQYKPLNLGQGFPDYYAPKNVTDALAATANSDNPLLQQYTRGFVSIHLLHNSISKYIYKTSYNIWYNIVYIMNIYMIFTRVIQD